MNYWFIRLGAPMYQYLAENENLVKIGFGIDTDMTGKNLKGIREHVQMSNPQATDMRSIAPNYSQVNKFINEIKPGDKIISPFKGNQLRLGTVQDECKTIQEFLTEEKLQEIIGKYPEREGDGSTGIKPARKVKWERDINLDEIPEEMKKEIDGTKRQTIHKLDVDKMIKSSSWFDFSEKAKIKKLFGDAKKEIRIIVRNVIAGLIVASIIGVFGFI